MKIFYRISDGSYKKERLSNATKKHCLENFLTSFAKDEIVIYADNVKDETFDWLTSYDCELIRTNGGSSAGGFRIVLDAALELPDNEVVYFVEDDYLHLSGSREILLEGIQCAHYVTLYDHIDKYIPGHMGGNPFIGPDGGEETKVYLTSNRHWKLTNSTTMTFATTVDILREDASIWQKFIQGSYPHDFDCFIELRGRGRSLISPIPSLSTHCDKKWVAPLIDWETI